MPEDIQSLERNVEIERGLLDRTIDQLTQSFSSRRITDAVMGEVRSGGGAVGQQALTVARANPAAVALVGLGVAALLAGPKKPVARQQPVEPTSADMLTPEFDARVEAADAAISKENSPRAPRLRAAMNNGLAHLPEPARRRVIKAREAAVQVQEQLDAKTTKAAKEARRFHMRNPLGSLAIAAGIGAVAGALLPRTKIEDDTLGAKRDALLQQAELTLKDELAKAQQSGEAALRQGIDAGYDRLRQH